MEITPAVGVPLRVIVLPLSVAVTPGGDEVSRALDDARAIAKSADLPAKAATAVVAATGNIYNGLWYPIVVAVMTAIIGGLLLHDTKDVDIKVGSGVEAAQRA